MHDRWHHSARLDALNCSILCTLILYLLYRHVYFLGITTSRAVLHDFSKTDSPSWQRPTSYVLLKQSKCEMRRLAKARSDFWLISDFWNLESKQRKKEVAQRVNNMLSWRPPWQGRHDLHRAIAALRTRTQQHSTQRTTHHTHTMREVISVNGTYRHDWRTSRPQDGRAGYSVLASQRYIWVSVKWYLSAFVGYTHNINWY